MSAALALAACDPGPRDAPPPEPVVSEAELAAGDFVEVGACRPSHEHELRHVRVVTQREHSERFEKCALGRAPDDPLCQAPFPAGALFVKYEYELQGCDTSELVSITASEKLAPGAYPAGRDWHWQRLGPSFRVEEDGAPYRCLLCHIDHCEPPYGHDLRCTPD